MAPEEYRVNQLEERIDQLETRFRRVAMAIYNALFLGLAALAAFVLVSQRASFNTWWLAFGALIALYSIPNYFIREGYRPAAMKYSQEFIASTFELNKQK